MKPFRNLPGACPEPAPPLPGTIPELAPRLSGTCRIPKPTRNMLPGTYAAPSWNLPGTSRNLHSPACNLRRPAPPSYYFVLAAGTSNFRMRPDFHLPATFTTI